MLSQCISLHDNQVNDEMLANKCPPEIKDWFTKIDDDDDDYDDNDKKEKSPQFLMHGNY